MSRFVDWNWGELREYLIFKNRYFLDKKRERIVHTIKSTIEDHAEIIKKDSTFWRARIVEISRLKIVKIPKSYYTDKEMLIPNSRESTEGRCNLAGIPYLYLSKEIKTAIAEVKPYLDANIDLIKVKLKKDIRVVSFQKIIPPISEFPQTSKEIEERISPVWFWIKLDFSVPYAPENRLGYIPIQYVSELFKSLKFDGIIFDSVQLKNGTNLALFNDKNVIPIAREKRRITSIKYGNNFNGFD
jgi:hypothetical protein